MNLGGKAFHFMSSYTNFDIVFAMSIFIINFIINFIIYIYC